MIEEMIIRDPEEDENDEWSGGNAKDDDEDKSGKSADDSDEDEGMEMDA